MLFGHSRPPAFTQKLFPYAPLSLQTPCIDLNAFSVCSSVIPDPLHLPKCLFRMLFGHSRPPALTQMPFSYALRLLQTSCIYPKAFSPCSSVTSDLLHLPKCLFRMLFGHSSSKQMKKPRISPRLNVYIS
jgi:hypothetical protein